ncbi:MAG: ribosome maturation factor RimP [Clostridia bacterium]|nr:ribosome maturation factor RimP [Clostridia bacterium]
MSKICDSTAALVKPIIESNGMELVEVEYKKLYGTPTLIVYIDKEGGVSLDDCEKIHRLIDAPLDELDPTSGAAYNLNVSSPGLDRPLKCERDYIKNIGKSIDLSLYEPVGGKKKFTCTLISYNNDTIVADIGGEQITLNIKQIAVAKPTITF